MRKANYMRHKRNKRKAKLKKQQLETLEPNLCYDLSNKFIEHDIKVSAVPPVVLLHELLEKNNIKSTIKTGYVADSESKLGGWHCWLQTEKNTLDVSADILFREQKKMMQQIGFKRSNKVLLEKLPDDYEQIDNDTEEEVKQITEKDELLELYIKSRDEFWNKASENLRQFREQMIKYFNDKYNKF